MFLDNLSLVSVVAAIVVSWVARLFLRHIISVILWCWSQKLFGRVTSDNNVFLTGSITLISTSIFFRFIIVHLIISAVILFDCSAEATLCRHPIVIFCCLRLIIKLMVISWEKLLLWNIHFIRYKLVFPQIWCRSVSSWMVVAVACHPFH